MTIINTGSTTATGVRISLQTAIPAIFAYQTTHAATNAVTGSANTPVDIPAGQSQTYVIGITPIAPLQPTEVTFNYAGNNTPPVAVLTGLNTLLLSASATPVPDIVALGATITADGIVNVAGGARTGDGVFAVATVNVGASSPITASVDTGGSTLPATATICETNAATSLCLAPPSSPNVTTQINTTATTTFGVFVSRSDLITLDPGGTRIFVRFKDANGITRGATSVAVRSTLFVPLFQQPFTGEFAVSNFFDHNVPQEFVDANGNMVTFWGEIVPFFDGHQGYDFPMPEGTPLLAVADGTVSFAGQSADFFCPPLNRTVNGPLIEIDHVTTEGTFKSLYFHLSRADVTIGQRGRPVNRSAYPEIRDAAQDHIYTSRRDALSMGEQSLSIPMDGTARVLIPGRCTPRGPRASDSGAAARRQHFSRRRGWRRIPRAAPRPSRSPYSAGWVSATVSIRTMSSSRSHSILALPRLAVLT